MSDGLKREDEPGGIGRAEMMSALFAQLVMQQANMAMLLLGKMPNPQTGETIHDIEAARLFIDQLEMLEEKTRGNLSKEEEQLLKQSLMSLRMAFVDAVESPVEGKKQAAEAAKPVEDTKVEDAPAAEAKSDDESKKKFTKKY